MGDMKSKLPDFNEISSIVGKLFKDVKKSIGEIIDEYKKKRSTSPKTKTKQDNVDTSTKEKKTKTTAEPAKKKSE